MTNQQSIEDRVLRGVTYLTTKEQKFQDYLRRQNEGKTREKEKKVIIDKVKKVIGIANGLTNDVEMNIDKIDGQITITIKACQSFINSVENNVKSIVMAYQNTGITTENIIHAVLGHFHLTYDQLFSSDRSRYISEPRHILFYLIVELNSEPIYHVQKKFIHICKGFHHSTIDFAHKKIENLMQVDKTIAEHVNKIINQLIPQSL